MYHAAPCSMETSTAQSIFHRLGMINASQNYSHSIENGNRSKAKLKPPPTRIVMSPPRPPPPSSPLANISMRVHRRRKVFENHHRTMFSTLLAIALHQHFLFACIAFASRMNVVVQFHLKILLIWIFENRMHCVQGIIESHRTECIRELKKKKKYMKQCYSNMIIAFVSEALSPSHCLSRPFQNFLIFMMMSKSKWCGSLLFEMHEDLLFPLLINLFVVNDARQRGIHAWLEVTNH